MADEKQLKVPKDIVQNLKEFQTETGLDMKDIKSKYKEVYSSDFLSSLDGEQRHEMAWLSLKGEMLLEVQRGTKPFIGQVIDWKSVRKGIKEGKPWKATDVFMLVKEKAGKDDELMFAEVTLWNDQTGLIGGLKRCAWYDVNLWGEKKNGIYNLSSSDNTKFKDSEEIDGTPAIASVLNNLFPTVKLADFDDHLSKGKAGDYKLVMGIVGRRSGGYKKGNPWGIITLVDDSQKVDAAKKGDHSQREITIFLSPEQVVYPQGSIVQVVGRLRKSENENPGEGEPTEERIIDGRLIHPIVVKGDVLEPIKETIKSAASDTGTTGGLEGGEAKEREQSLDDL